MSLQGTLDSFPLTDVLRLLAATTKTGRLRVDTGRGSGAVWVDGGAIVSAELAGAPREAPLAEVVFELLRDPEGTFEFDADLTTSEAVAAADVEPLIDEAQALLDEWKGIVAVVPSMSSWVTLVPELRKAQVMVSADQWRALAAIGGACTVEALAERFGLGELPVGRLVKDLVEAGFVAVDAADGHRGDGLDLDAPVLRPLAAPSPAAQTTSEDPEPGGAAEELAALAGIDSGANPELARQLARLGPAGVEAVAAAARADTPEEREAALAGLEEGDDGEPVNRGLLLKFLSSVRS